MKKISLLLASFMLIVSMAGNLQASVVKTTKNVSITASDYTMAINTTTNEWESSVIPETWSVSSVVLTDNTDRTDKGHAFSIYLKRYNQSDYISEFRDLFDVDETLSGNAYKNFKSIRITNAKAWSAVTIKGTRPQVSYTIDTTVTLSGSQSVKINGKAVTTAGTYKESLKTYTGGDSIVNWTVKKNTTAVGDVEVNTVKVYPNPVVNELRISEYTGVVTLFDMSGKVVLKSVVGNDEAIDVSGLKNGIYIVKGSNFTQKVFKR